jgi:hypothetical protein
MFKKRRATNAPAPVNVAVAEVAPGDTPEGSGCVADACVIELPGTPTAADDDAGDEPKRFERRVKRTRDDAVADAPSTFEAVAVPPPTAAMIDEASAASAGVGGGRTLVCKPFMQKGECQWGDDCRFAHVFDADAAVTKRKMGGGLEADVASWRTAMAAAAQTRQEPVSAGASGAAAGGTMIVDS